MIIIRRGCFSAFSSLPALKPSFIFPATTQTSQILIPKRKMATPPIVGLPLKETVDRLQSFAPSWLAESWDNVGLLIEPPQETNVKQILLTNDLTEDVMDEAISLKVDLILSYHPPLFKPFKIISNKDWKSRVMTKCIMHNIGVYSPHTSYDAISDGVNDWLARSFEFASIKPIHPCPSPPVSTTMDLSKCGAGRLLTLNGPMQLKEAIQRVKTQLATPNVHLALARGKQIDSTVQTVAVCAGSGSSVLAGVKADLLLTGEMSHHDVLDAVHRGSSVILTWHSTSERGYLKRLQLQLSSPQVLGNEVKIILSERDVEPMFTV